MAGLTMVMINLRGLGPSIILVCRGHLLAGQALAAIAKEDHTSMKITQQQ